MITADKILSVALKFSRCEEEITDDTETTF